MVTSDHGVSYRGGDKRRAPTPTNLEDLAFVPLFVKLPGDRPGRVVDRHVRTIDILPTIADALDVRLPWRVDGRSALRPSRGAPRVRVGRFARDYPSALARRHDALARRVRLFGSGSWADVFRLGPYGDLLGRPLASLRVAGNAEAEATIDEVGSRLVRSLGARSAVVPSPLMGTIEGQGVTSESVLAVALNGRIAAVTEAYEARGGTAFSALAPEAAFKPGRNDVRVFLLDGPARSPDLRAVPTAFSG